MACIKKQKNGSCSHYQCPFSDLSGYECVDIIAGKCEVGRDCVAECAYSFTDDEADSIESAQIAEIDALYNPA